MGAHARRFKAAMDHFNPILNWKPKQGSHTFPGQDGGTCINEAAIVAAGFPYRPCARSRTCRACFTGPICRLAMQLNDEAPDEERQHLLPFVTRLACAGHTLKVERGRGAYISRAHALASCRCGRASEFSKVPWQLAARRSGEPLRTGLDGWCSGSAGRRS